MDKLWAITNEQELYWCNGQGWVEDTGFNDSFDMYTEAEKANVSLPEGGRWIEMEVEDE